MRDYLKRKGVRRLKVDLNAAEYVVHMFGGVRQLAEVLGLHPSTVSHWVNGQGTTRVGKGIIPGKYQRTLLQKAKVMKIGLDPRHLIYGGQVDGDIVTVPRPLT